MRGAVAISALLTEWAGAEARRRGCRCEVVEAPIVVDLAEQAPEPYPAGEPLVVFAGSPHYDETIRFVLDAMTHVWAELPRCRLVVTGANPGDPASRWLASAAATAGDAPLEIAGYLSRRDLLQLYGRAHALLVPLFDDVRSRARFPTKIGEYLAAERPVVTSAVGEIPRYFTDGVDAVVCPPGDARAYGRRVVELLRDSAGAAAIGRAGRQLAAARFDYSMYGAPLRTAFAAAVEGGRR